MDINGNIYISGLPKSTCRTADLFKLFCRVAQVKKVKLSSHKGTATVALWDSSSVDFILSQKWTINGSTLVLKHANCYQRKLEKMWSPYAIDDHAKKRLTEPQPSDFTYSHYKESQAPFWIDVPHSESKMVTSRCNKRKRTWFSSFCHTPMTIQTCENRKKKTKLKRNENRSKEKRNKKTKSSMTVPKHKLYSAISQETKKTSADFIQDHLTSMIPNTETISNVNAEENLSLPNTETISSVNTEENPSIPNIETKSIVKTEENRSVSNIETTSNASSIDVTKSPVSLGTCNKNLLIRKRSFMFPRKVDETEHDKEKAITTTVTMETKRIPIYVHFSTQRYIIYITNDSLRDIQKGILEKSRIPIDLQMIVYQGRILGHTSNVALQPYDFVQVLVRGKGGMQNEETGATTPEGKLDEEIQGATGGEEREENNQMEEHETMKKENGAIALVCGRSEKSSTEDVQKWFSSIGITVEIIQKYGGLEYLDGETIFNDYSPNDWTKFASDTGVPIGLARKILMLRNKSKDEFTSEMAMWNSNKLNEYIEEFFTNIPNKEMIISLTAAIAEKMIDGLVFINYKNAEDMALDFKDVESLEKIVFIRLLKDRDKKYGKCDKKDQKENRKPNKTQNTPLKSDTPSPPRTGTSSIDQYFQFIEKHLHLKHLEDVDKELLCCKLKLIDTSWTKCDQSQKYFLFFVLCEESEYTTQNQERGLWKEVRKNIKQWVDICSENDIDLQSYQKKLAVSSGSKDISLLESTSSWKYLMEKELDDIKQFRHCILLITKQLNIENICYKIVLNANKKKPVFFHFSVEEKCNYILFDPEDDDIEFRIVPENTESLTRNIGNAKVSVPHPQRPRPFKVDADYCIYYQAHILPNPESSGTMSSRCIEYKLFTEGVAMKTHLKKFLKETLRFAAGCLNTRHNGTIYFGVGDRVKNQHKHGEIVGYPDKDNEVKDECTENLRSAIKSCFRPENNSSADKCISDPYFLRVQAKINSSGSNLPLYVMEIDIQPNSDVCEALYFEVNMAKCPKLKGVKGVKDKFILYVRDGSNTREIDEKEKKGFINRDLIDSIKSRRIEEAEKNSTPDSPIEKPINKLRRLLCKGKDKLDKSLYPIFVLGKPTEEQKNSNNSWMDTMSFIKRFPFISAVFDFDDKSNINGFSKTVRNEACSTIVCRKTFHQYIGDTKSLIKIYNCKKTVWIFANDQADLTPPAPRIKNEERQQTYIGVSDAVIFFSHPSVIPISRALILIMLFSNDFDGVIETFIEIHKRFTRPNQILILAEEKNIFKMFEESVSIRGGPVMGDLEGKSVVGIKWKHIRETIDELVGYDDCDFWLPGHLRPISEQFRERLSDLELLNAKQCEGKKSSGANARIQFKNEKEMEFYRGNKVSWWNFYYEGHVLKRNCFDNTRSKIENVLKYPKKQKYDILTFNLEHEPGAGGSTFVRHILWTFRKEYKCAVVKHLSANTPHQILDLWKSDFDVEDDEQSLLTQEENAMPLLILLDDILQQEVTYEDFIKEVKLVFCKETKSRNLKCLACICYRYRVDEVVPASNSLTEVFVQKLTDEEKIWMENKNTELEKEGNFDIKPENLLSFMALRTNFNQNKIESIVECLMNKLDVQSFEFDLVQFIALITEKTSNFRRSTKIAVPLECCDDFYFFSKDEEKVDSWERILSRSLNILLVFEDNETTGGKQIRMAHPMLAKSVLEYALQIKNKTLSALTIDMLKSNLMKSTSRGRVDVFEIVHHMLICPMVTDDEKQTNFSPLIESIIDGENGDKEKGYENAGEVLKEGLSLFINLSKFEKHAGTISQTLERLVYESTRLVDPTR